MTVALSWPRRYLVCIYTHLRVLACKLLISAEQLYVMTRIICCVTPMAASHATSMLPHDRVTAPDVAAVEDGMLVCVYGCDFGEFGSYGEIRTMCACYL